MTGLGGQLDSLFGGSLWQQGTEMPQIKMSPALPRILKTRPVIASPPDEPLVGGHGDTDYICAGCDRIIAENIELGEIKDLVFECSGCGMDNQIL